MLSFERRLGGLEGESHRSDLDVLYLHWPQAQKSKFIYSYNVCALQDRANGLLTAKVIRQIVVIAFTSRLGHGRSRVRLTAERNGFDCRGLVMLSVAQLTRFRRGRMISIPALQCVGSLRLSAPADCREETATAHELLSPGEYMGGEFDSSTRY